MIRESELILVSGAARSGKSKWAENLLHKDNDVTYIATHVNNINDEEWQRRLKKHKDRRPKEWKVIDLENSINKVLKKLDGTRSVLLDSLGGYVSKYLNMDETQWSDEKQRFLLSIDGFNGKIIIVIEEVGWGVSPMTKVGNLFRDRLGELSQELEIRAVSSWVVFRGRALNIADYGQKF